MFNKIQKVVEGQFKLDLFSDHGVHHWKRVEKIGLYLSKDMNVDEEVIKLFALLHDSKRENELVDPEHGSRAGIYAKELYKRKFLPITEEQLYELVFACTNHSNSESVTDNLTINICWDSDRLDLWRVGITPDPKYLKTEAAKNNEALTYSYNLYYKNNVYDN